VTELATEKKVKLVEKNHEKHGLNLTLSAVDLAKSTWYYWKKQKEEYEEKYSELKPLIREVIDENPEYGRPRITCELNENHGVEINHKVVGRLLKMWDLKIFRAARKTGKSAIEEIIDEAENDEEEEEEEEEEMSLREITESFLGADYDSSPLDEDNIYTEEAFNSTTLVLTVAANYHFPEDPEEGMRKIHYYPPGEVSYENRLHFSTYRNKVSEYFNDITREVGEDHVRTKEIVLNREREEEGRLLDMDWEEEIILEYINIEDIEEVLANLPEVAGVAFIIDGDEEMGLDVRSEGLIIDGSEFVHAPRDEGEVVKEDFLSFLEDSNYNAVNFFEINE